MATLLKVDGTSTKVYPLSMKKGFTLEEMYSLLECELIEMVSSYTGEIMVIDEEGKLKDNSQINIAATNIYVNGDLDPIVGNALICSFQEAGFQ